MRRTWRSKAVHVLVITVAMLTMHTATLAAQEWIYVTRDGQYSVVDPESGSVARTAPLESDDFQPPAGVTPDIVPTPGGRYVFFVYADQSAAIVVDAETHEVAWSVQLPSQLQAIQFSSMGDTVYALMRDGSRVALDHRKGEVSVIQKPAPKLDTGDVAFNRRATRIYGNRDDDLVYALASNGDEVDSVSVRSGPYDWRVSPNFRYLLGTSRDGQHLVLIDEQRARVIGYHDAGFSLGSTHFDAGSRGVHILTESGDRIDVLDVRSFRVQESIALEADLSAMWLGDDGRYHGISRDQRRIIVDAAGTARSIALDRFGADTTPLTAALVVLKPGQGFACF